jgi:hypothetical protein
MGPAITHLTVVHSMGVSDNGKVLRRSLEYKVRVWRQSVRDLDVGKQENANNAAAVEELQPAGLSRQLALNTLRRLSQ